MKKFFTITEAAKALKISRAAVHQAIRKARLEAHRGRIEINQVQVIEGWKISPKDLHKEMMAEEALGVRRQRHSRIPLRDA